MIYILHFIFSSGFLFTKNFHCTNSHLHTPALLWWHFCNITFICANVPQIWFPVFALVLVGTCDMKIDVSLYDFCKDMILLIVIYCNIKFLCICKTNYFTWMKIRRHGTNIEKITQDNSFPSLFIEIVTN